MAEDSDGQQITVAELLKRMGADQQSAAPEGRRRRRADEGGMRVTELTGEIPKITDETVLSGRAERRRAREAEEAAAKIRAVDLNTLTPIEAMNLLFELKKMLKD